MSQRCLRLLLRAAPAPMLFSTALLAGAQAVAAQVPTFAGNEIRVEQGPFGDPLAPQVAVFSDGGFVVAWTSPTGAGSYEVRARRFGPDDAPVTDELAVLASAPAAGTDS